MENNKNQQQQQSDNTSEGQNPTLNSPGSQVADYGNPTGGSASDTGGQQQSLEENPQQNANRASESNDTIGNP
ncbi:MAG TPA: hypothetical protein VGB71_08395 [Flavisolibacter sp.]|jgi:hypothetical protein